MFGDCVFQKPPEILEIADLVRPTQTFPASERNASTEERKLQSSIYENLFLFIIFY